MVSKLKNGWQQLNLTDRILIYIAFVMTIAYLAAELERLIS